MTTFGCEITADPLHATTQKPTSVTWTLPALIWTSGLQRAEWMRTTSSSHVSAEQGLIQFNWKPESLQFKSTTKHVPGKLVYQSKGTFCTYFLTLKLQKELKTTIKVACSHYLVILSPFSVTIFITAAHMAHVHRNRSKLGYYALIILILCQNSDSFSPGLMWCHVCLYWEIWISSIFVVVFAAW